MATLPDVIPTLQGDDKAVYDDIIARRAAKGVHHLGPYVPLSNHPRLAGLIERLGFFYKYEGVLPRDVFQFLVLEVGRRSGVEFMWRDHLAQARAAGLPEDVISVLSSGKGELAEPYALVRRLMDPAFAYESLPPELQAEATRVFGVAALLEIVTLCGFYSLIGMVNACFDVPLPPGPR